MPANFQQINTIQRLARDGQIDAALQQLRNLILHDDDDVNLWRLYAELAVDHHDLRFALQHIVRLQPDDISAKNRLRQLGDAVENPVSQIPDYAMSVTARLDNSGGEHPTARFSKKLMKKLGIKPGDFVRLSTSQGTTLPIMVEESRSRDDITLNAQAQRLLDVHQEGDIALIPPESLILLMDTSASMGTRLTGKQSRLDATQKAIGLLLDAKRRDGDDDRVGLIHFRTYSHIAVRPTQQFDEIRSAANRLQAAGATAMHEGLSDALALLRETDSLMKRIILLTDGVPTTSSPDAILKLAQQARREKVVIDTIGLGKPGQHEYDEALLRAVAEMTGGRFRYVDDLETLEQTFEQLAVEKRLLLKA